MVFGKVVRSNPNTAKLPLLFGTLSRILNQLPSFAFSLLHMGLDESISKMYRKNDTPGKEFGTCVQQVDTKHLPLAMF